MGAHIKERGSGSRDVRVVLNAIRRIVRSLRVASRAAEKDVGLSAAQLFVLQRLARGAPMSLNELAERTLTHQSSVSVVVSRLVARGMVERSRSAGDRRQLQLSLTPEARKLIRRAPDLAQDRLIDALHQLKPTQRKQLAGLLSRFVAAAGLAEQPAQMLLEEELKNRNGRLRSKEKHVRASR